MLILKNGQTGIFEFAFNEDGNFFDPTESATPSDVIISVYRGDLGSGAIIDGPYSYIFQGATPAYFNSATPSNNYIEKTSDNIIYYGDYGSTPSISTLDAKKFKFYYTIPNNLFPGNYSVVATTNYNLNVVQYTAHFQVPQDTTTISAKYPSGQKDITKAFVPAFERMEQYKTNSVILIGHGDGPSINDIIRINDVQEAIDLLKADFESPLLKGVIDAYSAGCRDIYICASAPMSEYVQDLDERLIRKATYAMNDATPLLMNFYERYYERLKETYSILLEHDYFDIIVPLETSFINTGNIDFLTQLATHCRDFHNLSGMIQIGIIGTRSNGIKESDITVFENSSIFQNKYTMFDENNQIIGDMGRFIIPVYGELVMNHSFLTTSHVASGSAVYAGMLSANPVNQSLIRKNLPSVFGLSGVTLNQDQVDRLDALGINTFTRNTRSRRGNTYQIYITNDNTLAHNTSNYRKAPQIRLVSMLINEIRALTTDTIGKFATQKAVSDVRIMLDFLKKNGIISDYQMEAYMDGQVKGKLYFDISVLSSLGLKKISFLISAGQGA